MVTRDPVRVYLDSVLEARVESNRLRRKLELLEARALNITSQLTGMPRAGSSDRDAVLAALADAARDYYQKLAAAERKELEVVEFIDSLPTMESRMILKLKYVDRKKWKQVLSSLTAAGLGMSERRMFQLHGAALNEAREQFMKKENNNDQS